MTNSVRIHRLHSVLWNCSQVRKHRIHFWKETSVALKLVHLCRYPCLFFCLLNSELLLGNCSFATGVVLEIVVNAASILCLLLVLSLAVFLCPSAFPFLLYTAHLAACLLIPVGIDEMLRDVRYRFMHVVCMPVDTPSHTIGYSVFGP